VDIGLINLWNKTMWHLKTIPDKKMKAICSRGYSSSLCFLDFNKIFEREFHFKII